MSIYPLNSLFSPLQIKPIPTKKLKPLAATSELVSKPKTQGKNEQISSEKKESVITLLKKHHFTDTQIAILEQKSPKILRFNAESILEPKLKFLHEIGFLGDLLPDLVVRNPSILDRSLVNHLIPNYEYLRELMKIDQAASVGFYRRAIWLLNADLRKILQPNIEFLLGEGVPMTNVLKLLKTKPTSLLLSVDKTRHGVGTVREFGFEPCEIMFIFALGVVMSMSESNWKRKVEVFKSLGWSDKDITATMARHPFCLAISEKKLRRTFKFFVQTMDLKPEDVIKNPIVCMYSLEKRTIPRCKVVMALKEKNLLKGFHIPTLLNMNEDEFIKRFILEHPDHSTSLWNLYRGAVPV